MKALAAFALLLAATPAAAQQETSGPVQKGAWDLGFFAGAGVGTSKAPDTQFFFVGERIGRVLTADHLGGWRRGNLEFAAEFMPAYVVFTTAGPIYGASFKPVILRWNFTANRHIVPYLHLAGGVLFSTSNVPPGNTSRVNFTPQGGGGIHWFRRPDQSLDFGCDLVHHSSAGLGTQNPGYNFSVFFTLGYSWFKNHQ